MDDSCRHLHLRIDFDRFIAVGARSLAVISDSQLIVGQVKGEYEAKKDNMEKYLKYVKELIKSFQAFSIFQVPREENMEADQLARLATAKEDLIPGGVLMQYLDAPSIANPVDEVQIVEYEGTWAEVPDISRMEKSQMTRAKLES
ncbi:hypothetical protein Vadar_005079 [Vaccinium darrowii]|uniref:Uncharacterized protein n=1 Tax=Vaccinium darrowii TaxID=229202 RepID=A0ACB7XYD2_9ERIC|nr:hypothetical protein Vadar_005079 [Vaccinium darrowii]